MFVRVSFCVTGQIRHAFVIYIYFQDLFERYPLHDEPVWLVIEYLAQSSKSIFGRILIL